MPTPMSEWQKTNLPLLTSKLLAKIRERFLKDRNLKGHVDQLHIATNADDSDYRDRTHPEQGQTIVWRAHTEPRTWRDTVSVRVAAKHWHLWYGSQGEEVDIGVSLHTGSMLRVKERNREGTVDAGLNRIADGFVRLCQPKAQEEDGRVARAKLLQTEFERLFDKKFTPTPEGDEVDESDELSETCNKTVITYDSKSIRGSVRGLPVDIALDGAKFVLTVEGLTDEQVRFLLLLFREKKFAPTRLRGILKGMTGDSDVPASK